MPSLLILPDADAHTLLSDIEPSPEYISVPEKLLLFDKLIIIKHREVKFGMEFGPASVSSGQSKVDTRLTIFDNSADQEFLMQNQLILAQPFGGNAKLVDVIEPLVTSFSKGNPAQGIGSMDVVIPDQQLALLPERALCLSMQFDDLLCLPEHGTPLDEVLDFKNKRQDEYDAFWDQLHELGADPAILCRADAAEVLKRKIKKSTEELSRVCEERWSKRVLQSVKIRLSFDATTLLTAMAAVAAAPATNIPPVALSLAGLASVRASLDLTPSIPAVDKPVAAMSYLSSIRRL